MGAPCPAFAKRAWIDWIGGEKIWELYAGTEVQAVTVIRSDDWLEHVGSVGRVSTGQMKIVDPETGEDLPTGQVGEIFLRVTPGGKPTYRYLGADARTIGDGWESLGDMGWFDEEGYLYLADRRADMILSGGANIYPAEIEAALNEHQVIESCAVIGLPDDDLGQVVHAICHTTRERCAAAPSAARGCRHDRPLRGPSARRTPTSGGCGSPGSGLIRRASTGVSESARHDGGACKVDHSWLDRSVRVLARLACWHGTRRVAADR
jgi:hypothetical protein